MFSVITCSHRPLVSSGACGVVGRNKTTGTIWWGHFWSLLPPPPPHPLFECIPGLQRSFQPDRLVGSSDLCASQRSCRGGVTHRSPNKSSSGLYISFLRQFLKSVVLHLWPILRTVCLCVHGAQITGAAPGHDPTPKGVGYPPPPPLQTPKWYRTMGFVGARDFVLGIRPGEIFFV